MSSHVESYAWRAIVVLGVAVSGCAPHDNSIGAVSATVIDSGVGDAPQEQADGGTTEGGLLSPGLLVQYFSQMEFLEPQGTYVDGNIEFPAPTGMRDRFQSRSLEPTTVSVRWSGQIGLEYVEMYNLTFATTGRARVWLGGALIIDGWVERTTVAEINAKAVALGGGWLDLQVDYDERAGDLIALLAYSSPSQPLVNVPTNTLRHFGTWKILRSYSVEESS